MVLQNGKVHHLIFIMALLANSSRGQTTGPTVTSAVSIVPGSTSILSIPKATTINLTSDFISGVAPTSTSAQPTQIIFITASSSSTSSATASPTVLGSTDSGSKLSASDLGAIIGGCAGGLLVLSILTAVFCIRRKKQRAKKEYDLSRGISASMIFNKDVYKQQEAFDLNNNNNTPLRQQHQLESYNPNDPNVKRYNVTQDKTLVEDEQVVTPPVISYTDVHNEQSASPTPQQRLTRATSQASKGARLSKYNFLSQAFSQMRTSYGGQALQQNHASEEEPNSYFQNQPAAPEPSFDKKNNGEVVNRSYHDSMVLSPYEFAGNQYSDNRNNPKTKYQMYSMYNSSTDSGGVRSGSALAQQQQQQQHSTSTFFDPNRESTITVGTLHAPLFHQQHQHNPTPPPFNKNLYTSGVITPSMDRDSVISDVSQYSTPKQETPTATTTSNKPYPYF